MVRRSAHVPVLGWRTRPNVAVFVPHPAVVKQSGTSLRSTSCSSDGFTMLADAAATQGAAMAAAVTSTASPAVPTTTRWRVLAVDLGLVIPLPPFSVRARRFQGAA